MTPSTCSSCSSCSSSVSSLLLSTSSADVSELAASSVLLDFWPILLFVLWLRVLVCVFIDLIVVVVVCCYDWLLLWLMLLLWLTFVKVQKVLHIKKGFYLCVLCVCFLLLSV